jgi:putative FmdB family regulatory protein
MPLYQYYCLHCERVFEAIVPLKEYDKKIKCPKCGKEMNKYVDKVHLSSTRATYGY